MNGAFLGMILGPMMAAAMWIVIGVILDGSGEWIKEHALAWLVVIGFFGSVGTLGLILS